MGTQVRDALLVAVKKAGEKYHTPEELAEKLGLNAGSAGGSLRELARKHILRKRMREGSRAVEYTAGPRFAFGEKYAGRKFPFHRNGKGSADEVAGNAVPAAGGGLGIVVKLDGQAHAITLAQAKELFQELRVLFG